MHSGHSPGMESYHKNGYDPVLISKTYGKALHEKQPHVASFNYTDVHSRIENGNDD